MLGRLLLVVGAATADDLGEGVVVDDAEVNWWLALVHRVNLHARNNGQELNEFATRARDKCKWAPEARMMNTYIRVSSAKIKTGE